MTECGRAVTFGFGKVLNVVLQIFLFHRFIETSSAEFEYFIHEA